MQDLRRKQGFVSKKPSGRENLSHCLSLSLFQVCPQFFAQNEGEEEKQFCCVCASLTLAVDNPKSLSISQNVECSRAKGEREREGERECLC